MRLFPRSWSPRFAVATAALILGVAGVVTIAVGLSRRQSPPPSPSASAAGTIASSLPTRPVSKPTSGTQPTIATRPPITTKPGLDFSTPTEITIPKIGVDSALTQLDQNPDGSVAVPTSFHVAGWYKHSVAAGQNGPSIILGHVDSKSGPGIFYRLGSLKPGDTVVVKRLDGKSATYVLTAVREYSKTSFPTFDVYGNTPQPTIRLVTCGGAFDSATGHYLSNIVAYGQLAA